MCTCMQLSSTLSVYNGRDLGRRHKSSLNKDQLDKIAHGPGLTDFVAGYAPQTPDHLIRKKGQRYVYFKYFYTFTLSLR